MSLAGYTPKQILIGAIVVMAMLNCLGWAIATFYAWLLRDASFFEPLAAEQVTENTQFAVLVTAVLIANIAGTLGFTLNTLGYGLPFLMVIQAADVIATPVLLNLHGSPPLSTTLLLTAGPAFVLLSLAILWRAFPEPG